MNRNSRSINSIRNISIGIGSQILIIIFSFISRTIFIKTLGAEYLGVNGLYTNILTVLSLAELGIGNVMIFSLYKPVAENNRDMISFLINYYKKIYIRIAIAVLLLGLAIIPFLNIILNSQLEKDSLIFYYILFLCNSVASYFVAYKSALINADQKNYITKLVQTITTLTRDVIQIFILFKFENYELYLLTMIVATVTNNIIINNKANKLYPFIKERISFLKFNSNEIKENIKSMFVYKFGTVLMNNTDNILISTILGTVYVGYYSNYYLLVTTVMMFINILIQGVMSSVGNLNASSSSEKSYEFFNLLLLFFHGLAAFCSMCFLLVFNDFILLWIGPEFILGMDVIAAIVFNFYIQNIINPVWMYRETMGLFKQIKYIMVLASIINLILSVILGLKIGLAGIIISTALARILTSVWYEPLILYKLKFNKPVTGYWKKQSIYIFISFVSVLIGYLLLSNLEVSLQNILFKIIISFIITITLFYISSYKSDELFMMKRYILNYRSKIRDKF